MNTFLLNTESLTPAGSSHVQVFLRIRPASEPVENENQKKMYIVNDPWTLLVKSMDTNNITHSKSIKSNENSFKNKYRFTKIFNLETDQVQFFINAVMPSVNDFLMKKNSTILTYGTLNAGKSYTMFGSISEPGVISQSIKFIYSSLNCTFTPLYKINKFNNIVSITNSERILESEEKHHFLANKLIHKFKNEQVYKEFEQLEQCKKKKPFENSIYSLWISFIEIYNEAIFDLLEMDEDGKNIQLKLANDKNGVTYVQGMRSICAMTGLEAYAILVAGQSRLTRASTLNYKSSRSHSIFIIKLLKYKKDSNASAIEVRSMSFCDLAGIRKVKKSVSSSKQLQESRNINTSLFVLGRCLQIIAKYHSRQSTGPFRDSKLTRLLQHSFCNKENIIFLINMNPARHLFAETQSVLKFALTAMTLTSEFSTKDKRCVDKDTSILIPEAQESLTTLRKTSLHEQQNDNIILKNKQLDEFRDKALSRLKNEYVIDFDLNWKNEMVGAEEEKFNLYNFFMPVIKNYYNSKLDECTIYKHSKIGEGNYKGHLDVEIPQAENLSTVATFENLLESLKNDIRVISNQNNKYVLQLLVVKQFFKIHVEFINNSDRKLKTSLDDININSIDKIEAINLFDKDVISCISMFKEVIYKLNKLNKFVLEDKCVKSAKIGPIVHCNVQSIIVNNYSKEIKKLLHSNNIMIPNIDNCLNSSENNEEIIACQITTILCPLKELFIAKIPKAIRLQVENNEKSYQLKVLKMTIEQQERDVSQMKIQCQELETIKLSLERTIEDFEIKSMSQDFLNIGDYSAINLRNSSIKTNNECIAEQYSPLELAFDTYSDIYLSNLDPKRNDATRKGLSSVSNEKNSGLAYCIKYFMKKVNDKICQTNVLQGQYENKINFNLKNKNIRPQYELFQIRELSHELENMKTAMTNVKKNFYAKEAIIMDYAKKHDYDKFKIKCLNEEKNELEIKCIELTKMLNEVKRIYTKKVNELQVMIKIHEDGEIRAIKNLDNYLKKSIDLECQLNSAYAQLDETSVVYKEQTLKLNKLEDELNIKILSEKELIERMHEYEKDHSIINDLLKKVQRFEITLMEVEREKANLKEFVKKESKIVSEVEQQTTGTIGKFQECDNQVTLLKLELDIIRRASLANRRKAIKLNSKVIQSMNKIKQLKQELNQTAEAREDLEDIMNNEIKKLRNQLIMFEEKTKFLNLISIRNKMKPNELGKLQAKLLDAEKKLLFFKKSRNAIIRRYECLMRHYQHALKMNNHFRKRKVAKEANNRHMDVNNKFHKADIVSSLKLHCLLCSDLDLSDEVEKSDVENYQF